MPRFISETSCSAVTVWPMCSFWDNAITAYELGLIPINLPPEDSTPQISEIESPSRTYRLLSVSAVNRPRL